jgi:hypothetical protein
MFGCRNWLTIRASSSNWRFCCASGACEVQRLDRHLPLQMRIAREIDDALGASTQFTNDLETPNVLAHAS